MNFRLIIFTLLLSSVFGYSQNFNGGIITGLTATQISGDQLGGYNKLGLNIGGFVNVNTGKYSSLQMELKFIQKGSKSVFSIFDTTAEQRKIYRLRLSYIEMPFVYKYSLKALAHHQTDSTYHFLDKLTFEIGLAYAVLLSSKEEDFTGVFQLYSPPFNKYDFSAIAGIYYQIKKNIQVNFRRTGSILPVRKHSGDATYRLNMGQYNDVVELSLKFQFNNRKNKSE